MKNLLIKISGELFSYKKDNVATVESIAKQIKELAKHANIALVLGGGNFFRGSTDGASLKLQNTTAHNIGMLSTIVNGLVLKDFFEKADICSTILSAFHCGNITKPIGQCSIKNAFEKNKVIIFVGGTGNPFFTTDTNAVLRALQIGATCVWKATKVDGVYESDPLIDKDSIFHKKISYSEVLEKEIEVIDRTAITLAEENNLPIRVFNLFAEKALQKAFENPDFGSTIIKR